MVVREGYDPATPNVHDVLAVYVGETAEEDAYAARDRLAVEAENEPPSRRKTALRLVS